MIEDRNVHISLGAGQFLWGSKSAEAWGWPHDSIYSQCKDFMALYLPLLAMSSVRGVWLTTRTLHVALVLIKLKQRP
jgi:hypothetical protein